MIKAAVSVQQNIADARKAARDAVREAIAKLGGKKPDILFMFSSIKYDQKELIAGAKSEAYRTPIVGGTAAGEITSWASLYDAVNVMAIVSDQIKFHIGCGRGVSKDSFKAGADAATKVIVANNNIKPDLFIMIPDGMTGNGAAIVEGAKSILGKNFPIIGGSTGDDYLFKKTFEYCNGKLLTDSVVGIGVSGNFSYGFGIRHGWEPVGLPLTVTKSEGVVLKEINHEPALKVYQDYFGKNASDLIKEPLARMAYTYPLGIAVEGSDELLIRDPVVADDKGEITMAAAIPEGTPIRLMIGDRDAAIRAAETAAEIARGELGGRPARFAIMFNCMARNKLLGVRCNDENKKVHAALGENIPMIGFYTYGEQGPLLGKKNTPAYFHNETMTMLVVGE
ncbi:MAG: FIST N-terminal domain-containing protein [bacterium]|nr:FIST N-terminal domain-containing protein [bacterium]